LTTNLLQNAIIHNLPEGGTVRIATGIRSTSAILTIENSGEALGPQMVQTLTEPFQRGVRRTHTDHGGAGLGLAIVKSITQAHDGTLTLSPRADGGLRVMVQLPGATEDGAVQAFTTAPARGPVPAPRVGRAR
jgi:two-component system sensor histidine kinase VanS